MIDRAIGLAGIALTIIFGVLLILQKFLNLIPYTLVRHPANSLQGYRLLTVFPSINRKIGWAGLAFGVLLLGVAGGIAFFPDGQAQSPPATLCWHMG
jgi:hypothetical protein